MRSYLNVSLALVLFFSEVASACSAFYFQDTKGNAFFSKSFDFYNGDGAIFVNYRNFRKTALVLNMNYDFHAWTSRYGSITFSQISRDFPYGGINEKGLGVEILWLDQTQYDGDVRDQGLPTLNESQMIQYLLDTAATVDEAIAQVKKIQVKAIFAKAHYMVCDLQECAVIEYLNGQRVINKVKEHHKAFVANDTYEETQKNLAALADRGHVAAELLQMASNVSSGIDFAGKTLNVLAQKDWSRWQIVYNLSQKMINFRLVGQEKWKTLKLSDFDFSTCEARPLFIDLAKLPDEIKPSNMTLLTYKRRRQLMNNLGDLPDILKTVGAVYPSVMTECLDSMTSRRGR